MDILGSDRHVFELDCDLFKFVNVLFFKKKSQNYILSVDGFYGL